MKIACNNCFSEKCFIYNSSLEQSVKLLEQSKNVIRFKKGQYIFNEGSVVQGIYVIQSGKVKVMNTGFNEKKQIIRFAKSSYLLGHRGFGDKYYQISAVAIEDSTLCFIEGNVFTQLLKSDPEFTYQLMLFYAEELRIAEARMKNLAQMTVEEKTAEALLLMKRIFGVEKKKGEIELDVSLGRKDIAELAGLSSEQITRCFSEFKKENIIRIKDKRIIILNIDTLYKFIAPYYPSHIFRETYQMLPSSVNQNVMA